MCGIAGIYGIKDKELARSKAEVMAERIKHRGPDATGFFVQEDIALAHLRLSIIDLSEAANQPMADASGRYHLTYNGEIFNFRDIKATLTGYPFRTNSDSEVILAAYDKHGPDCLSLLNGMFALAIWDSEKKELFIARDRLGVKPLYYASCYGGEFIFASEMRSILSTKMMPRQIDREALYEYLMYQSVYAPRTIVRDIRQLPAGNYGVISEGKLSITPYWQIEQNCFGELENDVSEVKKKVRQLLLESVERRMISDVRLGAFLSGGIDSSAVVALMAEISKTPVDTFSVTFAEKEFDESRYSDLIANKYNTRHTKVELSAGDFLAELPNALKAADSPSGDGINTYVVAKATKKAGITVALSGLGGDELFAGYSYFQRWLDLRKSAVFKAPAFARKPVAMAISATGNSKYQRAADMLRADNVNIYNIYPIFRQVMSQQMADAFLPLETHDTNIRKLLKAKHHSIEQFPLLSQFSIAELLGYTQNVLLKDLDQFSMASALEVREPFFDHKLVEYVMRISDDVKYPIYPKSLLVEALNPLLPDEVVHRPKMGFTLPLDTWMRHELKGFCEERLNRLAGRGLLDPDQIIRKWDDFLAGRRGVLWSSLWPLVVLTEWLENNEF
jgi:asparagine synthase (glutamine-hydrolysing)